MITTENHSRKLLIIDSDKEISTLLINYFTEQGIIVKAVTDPTELSSIMTHYQPQVLLVDYTPVMVNSQLLWQHIKTDPLSAVLPLVVYSTTPQLQQLQQELGCPKILSKPFDLYMLQASIMNCFAE